MQLVKHLIANFKYKGTDEEPFEFWVDEAFPVAMERAFVGDLEAFSII